MWRVRLFVVALLVVGVCLFLAIRYLPAWLCTASAIVLILLPFVLRLILRWKVRSFVRELGAETPPGMPPLFAALFKMKGSVLRKARVVVHSVQPTVPPPPAPRTTDDRELPANQLLLDHASLPPLQESAVGPDNLRGAAADPGDTTAPTASPRDYYWLDVTIKPTRWGIGFKRWQPGELALTAAGSGWLDADDTCAVVDLQVQQGDTFGPEDDLRYAGAQRLRLLIGVRPGTQRLVFRYFTEQFGEVVLPTGPRLPPT